MSSCGPTSGNVTAHPRPRKSDATDAMMQKLLRQIARAANPKANPESSKQTKLTTRYDHRKYGPSEACTRTQPQKKEKPRTKAGRLKNMPHPAITIAVHLSALFMYQLSSRTGVLVRKLDSVLVQRIKPCIKSRYVTLPAKWLLRKMEIKTTATSRSQGTPASRLSGPAIAVFGQGQGTNALARCREDGVAHRRKNGRQRGFTQSCWRIIRAQEMHLDRGR